MITQSHMSLIQIVSLEIKIHNINMIKVKTFLPDQGGGGGGEFFFSCKKKI